jgi:hypothetical protein
MTFCVRLSLAPVDCVLAQLCCARLLNLPTRGADLNSTTPNSLVGSFHAKCVIRLHRVKIIIRTPLVFGHSDLLARFWRHPKIRRNRSRWRGRTSRHRLRLRVPADNGLFQSHRLIKLVHDSRIPVERDSVCSRR